MTSSMALGAMDFGTRIDERSAFTLLDRYVDGGGEWIDTADCYAFWLHPSQLGGQSEAVIGRWLAARPGVRDKVRISTKVGREPTIPGSWPESSEGLSAPVLERAVRDSLRRLQTDHVDLYWAHGEDRATPLDETVDAFGRIAAQGLADRLGASNHAAWRVERARLLAADHGVTGYSALQVRHSYLSPRPWVRLPEGGHQLADADVLDYAASEHLETWFYTPLLSGAYVREDRPLPEIYDHPGTRRRLEALDLVVRETGWTRNQVVLAWLRGVAPVVRPIVGVSTLPQLDEALGADAVLLDPQQRALLDDAA